MITFIFANIYQAISLLLRLYPGEDSKTSSTEEINQLRQYRSFLKKYEQENKE